MFFVGLGFGFLVFHSSTAPKAVMPGAQVQNDTFNFTGGVNVGSTNQFAVSSAGAVSSSAAFTTSGALSAATYLTATNNTTSSSSPIAAGSAAAGHMIIAAAATTGNASTTAVTANSEIFYTVEQVTPIAGTTCNTTIPTSTPVTAVQTVGSGFQVKVTTAPVTNPLCLSWHVIN